MAKLRRLSEARDKLNQGIAFNEAQPRRSPKSRSVLSDLTDNGLARADIEKPAAATEFYRKSLGFADEAPALQERLAARWAEWHEKQPQSALIAAR